MLFGVRIDAVKCSFEMKYIVLRIFYGQFDKDAVNFYGWNDRCIYSQLNRDASHKAECPCGH